MNWKVYLEQSALKDAGFDPGPVDGIAGRKTRSAFNAFVASKKPKVVVPEGGVKPPSPWAKIKTFGPHGIKGGYTPPMVRVKVPWLMKLNWSPFAIVKNISCHKLVAPALEAFLAELYEELGDEGIKEYGFDKFDGSYNPRKSRGGSSMSDHAWAIAFDWNSKANGNRQQWSPSKKMPNGTKQFSRKIVAIAKKHGFTVGFKSGSGRRDMMHFAYVKRA